MKELQQRLGYEFKNNELIIEALTHKSYKKGYNNERLEYLGDAVLDLVVAEYLFNLFPKADEGELSKMRAALVNEKSFTLFANQLGLGEHILISSAEQNNNGRLKPSILSNAFEALMGAVYLEQGLPTVAVLMARMLEEIYPKIDMGSLYKDYKTALQELTQSMHGTTPDYQLVDAVGPDHKKEFTIAVFVDGKELAKAKGASKKEAQQACAQVALELLLAKGK
jgi:ribonuclease-3